METNCERITVLVESNKTDRLGGRSYIKDNKTDGLRWNDGDKTVRNECPFICKSHTKWEFVLWPKNQEGMMRKAYHLFLRGSEISWKN